MKTVVEAAAAVDPAARTSTPHVRRKDQRIAYPLFFIIFSFDPQEHYLFLQF
jgi:hypothetical protein